jgi:hypothetical protein
MKSFYFIIIPILFIVLPSCKKSEALPVPVVDPREKFLGSWKATDSFTEADGTIVTQTYTFDITLGIFSEEFILLNRFANLNLTGLPAEVVLNAFTVAGTGVPLNNSQVYFEATGELTNDKLMYEYSIIGSGLDRQYKGTAVKQ